MGRQIIENEHRVATTAHGKANESGLRFICEHMSIDWGKAKMELGYTPRITLREGLADSLRWMTSQGILST